MPEISVPSDSPWQGRLNDVVARVRSSGLGGRALALFAVLGVIKILLLLQVGEDLFASHWRISHRNPTWFDHVNFWGFVLLFARSFLRLGLDARHWSTRTIRSLNAAFIITGLAFAFFSFQQVGLNYLYPVMQGVLSLSDLRWYLALNLFFDKPWLTVYLVAYPFCYWLLLGWRREAWSIFLLGGMATIYLVLNLRDLVYLGDALLVVNCFGLLKLIASRLSPNFRPWPAVTVLLLMISAAWVWFSGSDQLIRSPDEYLILLVAVSLTLALGIYLATTGSTARIRVSQWLPFYLMAFLLLSNQNYETSPAYTNLIIYGATLPHYFIWEILSVGLLVGIGMLVGRRSPRAGKTVFDVAALPLIAVATVDLLVTRTMGMRLDWHLLTLSDDATKSWRTVRPYTPLLAAGGLAVVGIYYLLGNAARRLQFLVRAGAVPDSGGRSAFTLTLIALMALAGQLIFDPDKATGTAVQRLVASSPFMQSLAVERLPAERFIQTATSLGLPAHLTPAPAPTNSAPAGLNVLLVVMESTYNRYLSLFGAADETQPLLKKYRDRMELFANYYSPFPNSFHARFSIFNGLYAPREYVSDINPRIPCPSLFEILHDHGYFNSVFYSSSRNYTQFNDYLGHRQLDIFHDCDTMPGREKFRQVSWGIEEGATLAAIQAQLRQHATRRDRFCLTYIPAAPHMPFDTPSKDFDKFDNGIGSLDHNYTGRYKNQLLYMDWIITSIIDTLAEQGLLEQTLVFITNDHGEMVGEDHGMVGHGWNLNPRLCNTPLIVLDPRRPGARVNQTLGSHVDLLPTLLDRLALPLPAGELYQGVSLDSPAARADRTVYLNSYRQRALIRGGQYLWFDPDRTAAGATVFDIQHQDAATVFKKTGTHAEIERQHEEYVRLQKSLIVHYARYRTALAAAARPAGAKSADSVRVSASTSGSAR